ncbi:MAG: hypothetical protein AAF563_00145 [Pseudomonadota bacterium]
MSPFSLAVVCGGLIIAVLAPFAGGRELLDTGFFFVAGVPAGMAMAAVFAWRWPQRGWSYGLAVALGQCLMTFVFAGAISSLFPVTLLLFLVLALPMAISGAVAGWLQRRHHGQSPDLVSN